MSKIYLKFILLLIVAFSGVGIVRAHAEEKARLNPPDWILGSWSNLAESNTNNFETFEFTHQGIRLLKGFSPNEKMVDFNEKFSGFQVKETVEPALYRVVLTRGKDRYIYEFRICGDCAGSSTTEPALTYSITKNGRVVREHFKSVNLVLMRRKAR